MSPALLLSKKHSNSTVGLHTLIHFLFMMLKPSVHSNERHHNKRPVSPLHCAHPARRCQMKTWKTVLAASSLLLLMPLTQAAPPSFEQYPAKRYQGKNAAVKLNADTRSFRTRFRDLSHEKANFAGHYAVGYAGCGTGCVLGMMVDVKNGATQFIGSVSDCPPKEGFEGWRDKDIAFKPNSRLLIITGIINEDDNEHPVCSKQYWLEQNGKLKRIRTEVL